MTHTVEPDAFEGPVLRGKSWRDASYDDLRVAVLAPGHQAAGIVPEIARTARSVKVFQEGPDWLVPLPVPLPRALVRPMARVHLRLAVHDRWLRRRLTPDARFNQRRPWVDRRYYAALEQPHCTLISWPVYAIVPAVAPRTCHGSRPTTTAPPTSWRATTRRPVSSAGALRPTSPSRGVTWPLHRSERTRGSGFTSNRCSTPTAIEDDPEGVA